MGSPAHAGLEAWHRLVRNISAEALDEILAEDVVFHGDHDAVLEFMTEIDGITVNGVDMIRWDEAGKIVEFKVMIRPLKAIQKVHAQMASMLEGLKRRS